MSEDIIDEELWVSYCERCWGDGYVVVDKEECLCPKCGGSGVKSEEKENAE